MLNPGASGQTRNQGIASCLILEAGKNDWRVTAHRLPTRYSSASTRFEAGFDEVELNRGLFRTKFAFPVPLPDRRA